MTRTRGFIIVWSSQAKISYLEYSSIVDEEIGRLHVSVEDFAFVQIGASFKKLFHVAFPLGFGKLDLRILEQTRKIMVHVGRDHEHAGFFAGALGTFDGHFFERKDVGVVELLEQFDLSKGSDGKAILLVVHEDLLQCDDATGLLGAGL